MEASDLVREKYRDVACDARGQFNYPVGRPSAERLGYDPALLDRLPREVVDRFVGVGNPFAVARPGAGDAVLDVGCGCGFDTFVAASYVGQSGRAVGIDLTAEMLDVGRRGLVSWRSRSPEFIEASIEALPFPDGTFDVVLSNGVLNLVPDKDQAFCEIARVLRPGGAFGAADLLVIETVPEEVLADPQAWAT